MITITPDVRDILERGRIEGFSYFLPAGKLERKMYEAVNKVLTNAGGKWDRKSESHVFTFDPSQTLGLSLKTGVSRNVERDARKMPANQFHRLHNLRMENTAAGYAMAEMRPRFEHMANRHENGTAPRAVAAYQLFQTPPELAVRLVAALGALPPLSRVLEPSAGLGRILDAIPRHCETVAVEIAPQCARELYEANRVNVRILQRDFLTVTPAELGAFDVVAMNPPFHLRSDIAHILHAKSFLAPNGRLAALCLDTPHREKALKPLASTWERIEGAFSKEGTRVATVLLTIQA